MGKVSEKNIIFIDGNTVRRKQVSSRLRMQGHKVELAQGGFHAIQLIEKYVFDLVIVQGDDLEDMPAPEVVGLIRNIHTLDELPVLSILLIDDDELAGELAKSGVNKIITDNGNFNLIVKEVQTLVTKK